MVWQSTFIRPGSGFWEVSRPGRGMGGLVLRLAFMGMILTGFGRKTTTKDAKHAKGKRDGIRELDARILSDRFDWSRSANVAGDH